MESVTGSRQTAVALVPIKGHSERITGKNFRPLAGKPLFRWIVDTLLSLPEIDKVVINSDARQLLLDNGLEEGERVLIRDRKPELCGDFTSMNKVLADDVQNVPADLYVMTHATNPLLSASTIGNAIRVYSEAVAEGRADSLFAVNKYQTRFYRADGSAVNHDPANLIRTQDLEPWFEENSNLYLFSQSSFAKTNARIGARPMLFETPRLESMDIDDHDGWRLAEIVALSRQTSA